MGWIGLDICQGLTVLIKDTVLGLIVIFTSHLNKFKNSIKFQVSWTLSNIFACTIKIMFSIALIWVQIQAEIIPILICQCLGQRDHYVTYCFICMIRCHGIKTGGLFLEKNIVCLLYSLVTRVTMTICTVSLQCILSDFLFRFWNIWHYWCQLDRTKVIYIEKNPSKFIFGRFFVNSPNLNPVTSSRRFFKAREFW